MTFNVNYEWHTVSRFDIMNCLECLSEQFIDKTVSVKNTYLIFSKELKKKYPIISNKIYRVNTLDELSIGGHYYYTEDRADKRSIQVFFLFKKGLTEITFSKQHFTNVLRLVADTIMHEIIHLYQYRAREYTTISDNYDALLTNTQQYYASTDEIEAYSFNIACELSDSFLTETEILQFLESSYIDDSKSCSMDLYMRAFEYDINHPVIKVLYAEIKTNISRAKLGKPSLKLDNL
jgi:DNA-binding ferritin-like protein (Dps family)